MRIDVTANANLKQVGAEVDRIKMSVDALNHSMMQSAVIPLASFDKRGEAVRNMENLNKATHAASRRFGNALVATGEYRAEMVRLNDVVDTHIKKIQKQKATFSDVWSSRNRDLRRAAKAEQLALQRSSAYAAQNVGIGSGKTQMVLGVPANVLAEWDTLRTRIGFVGYELSSVSRQMVNWGKNTQWAGRQLMVGFTYPVAAFGAATGYMAYEVDKQLTRIAKVYDTVADQNATTAEGQLKVEQEIAQLRTDGMKTAIDAAKEYGSAVTDTLSVQAELAATGISGQALQDYTKEVQRVGLLGELDVDTTTKALISLRSVFRMTADEASEAFDYINAIENASSLQMEDFATAIPIAAAPIREMGGDIKDLGMLLVAMKERGIQAAEGANAIKAMMQRLYRPSKKVREEWEAMGLADPGGFSKETGGDIMKMLPLISAEVDKLSNADRIKALAGLFGTYQVTRMSAMLDGLKGLTDESSQVSSAFKVAGMSAEELRSTADGEIRQLQESASGRFKRMVETIKASMAEIGEPFLNAAAWIGEKIIWLMDKFNQLPDSAKQIIAVGAMFLAAAGPIIMVGGLLANFLGNMGLVAGAALKLVGGLNLMNRGQKAAEIQSKLASAGLISQADAAQALTRQMQALALATNEAHAAQLRTAGLAVPNQLKRDIAADTLRVRGPQPPTQEDIAKFYTPVGRANKGRKGFLTNKQMAEENKVAWAEAEKKAVAERLAVEKELLGVQDKQEVSTAKTRKNVSGAAISAGLFSAALAASFVPNETVQQLANWAMLGSVAVPAVAMLAKGMAKVVSLGAAYALSMGRAAKSAYAASLAQHGGRVGAAKAGAKGVLAGAAQVFTKSNVALMAGTAVVAGIGYLWKKNRDEAKKMAEEIKKNTANQKELLNASQAWAESVGDTAKNYDNVVRRMKNAQGISVDSTFYNEQAEYFKLSADEGGGANQVEGFKSLDSSGQTQALMRLYIDSLGVLGMTAKQAQARVTAFLVASGEDFQAASSRASGFARQMGTSLENINFDEYLKTQANALNNFGKTTENWLDPIINPGATFDEVLETNNLLSDKGKANLKMQSENFSNAIVAAISVDPTDVQERMRLNAMVTSQAMSGWEDTYSMIIKRGKEAEAEIGAVPRPLQQIMDAGVNDAQSFAVWARKQVNTGKMTWEEISQEFSGLAAGSTGVIGSQEIEKSLINSVARALGLDNADTITTVWELETDVQFNATNTSYREAVAQAKEMVKTMDDQLKNISSTTFSMPDISQYLYDGDAVKGIMRSARDDLTEWEKLLITYKKLAESTNTQIDFDPASMSAAQLRNEIRNINENLTFTEINAFNTAFGFAEGSNKAEALNNLLNQTKIQTGAAANEAERLKNNLNGIEFTGEEAVGVIRTAMQEVQSAMSDTAMQKIDDRADRAQAANDEYWEKRQEELDARQEKEMERFDKRWENRIERMENWYDKRVDMTNKAIEAEERAEEIRQRIFAAEQTRLQRLTESGNRTIDFNVALRTGDLDEAARVRNDMRSAAIGWAMEDGENANLTASQKKIERLEGRRDVYEEAKEKRLEMLKEREEAERKSLQKTQKMQADALRKETDNSKKALQKQFEYERQTMNNKLTLFKSYTARNQKDLERWMRQVGLSYDDFGSATMRKGDRWSQHFGTELQRQIRIAGNKVASDKDWESWGKSSAWRMMKGVGFPSMESFRKFIRTGDLDLSTAKNIDKKNKGSDRWRNAPESAQPQYYHTGGRIGIDKGGRNGIARTTKGLHRNEVPIIAERGEAMVNKRAYSKNSSIIDAMNSGTNFSMNKARANTGDGVGGGGAGFAGLMSAFVMRGLSTGVNNALANKAQETAKSTIANNALSSLFGGRFLPGAAGQFGALTLTGEQLKNASIIASVGSSMGMSSRDIQIGIMTAITESMLKNINYGDRDSLGLFQQRPSMGWGTPEQVTNPEYAAKKFFSTLKGVDGRDSMPPWLAAQAVQRSFDSTGSNFRKYWETAQAIFAKGLVRSDDGFDPVQGGFTPGKGGWQKPSVPGKGWSNSHDYRNGLNSPLYAHANSRVIESRAVRGGGTPGNGLYGGGYSSYGETIVLQGPDGAKVRYAHLAPGSRKVNVGDTVPGGTLIGLSGNTGNSTGPHTHFDINGDYNARAWFKSRGIGLKTGGYTLTDGMANLHKDEVVIDPARTKKMQNGIDAMFDGNLSSGDTNVTVNLYGANVDANEVANKVIQKIKREESRKPGTRRVGP